MKRDSDLMYTCSLVECIGRTQHLRRSEVVRALGSEALSRIYRHAGVLHSEPIQRVADVASGDVLDTLQEVYTSWIDAAISDYNTDFYYQPRDYIRECYRAGRVLRAQTRCTAANKRPAPQVKPQEST